MVFQTYGFETILNPRSCCLYTGKESVNKITENIKMFKDDFGSVRFVFKLNGRNISELQLMIREDCVVVSNVITLAKYRKMGYVKKLWTCAKSIYPVILHSPNLSEDGKIFSQHCI